MFEQNTPQITGERRDITLLFADLREFSTLTGALGTEQAFDLLGDVMDAMTSAVMDHDGTVVDYYGDGLAAMWNAPADQPDHPELACRAALHILDSLPVVQQKWAHVLADKLRAGIGVHTGVAKVGNAGSNRRVKYGPRGANVHLASRVEAASKLLGVPALVTRATATRLSNRILAYRLCCAQLPGIQEPVELYGIRPPTTDRHVLTALADYQRASDLFERGRLETAAEYLDRMGDSTCDLPIDFLANQIRNALGNHGRRSTDPTAANAGPVITLNVK